MATNIPVTVSVKANVDPAVQKAFQMLSKLAEVAGKDIKGTAKDFAQLAKEAEELAAASAQTAQAMSTLGKESKKAVGDQATAAKQMGDAMKTAGEKSAQALKQTSSSALTTVVALREVSDSLQETGGPAAQGLKSIGAGLLDLASKAAQTAQEFEVFEAQLKTILGTQERASQAFAASKDFAVATPFDVKEIVEATVTLETYGQRSQEVLPQVASLAAGMNKELGATALVVGKAMSGSLEGFESLRNEYGISTRELAKYGAETTKTGGILVQTSGQIDKARTALAKIIEVRFDKALADRAKTVSAAMSNAGDAMISFAADVGEGVSPFIRLGAVLTEKVFSALTAMPTAMKAGLGATLTLGAGITGLGAVAITTTLALFRLDLELKKIVASNAAAATATGLTSAQMGILTTTSKAASAGATVTSAALTRLGTAASLASKAFTLLTRTPVGIALTAASVAGSAAYAAINKYANAQVAAAQKIADTSKTLTEQAFAARQVTETLKELGGEAIRAALAQETLGARSEALAKALKDIPAGELADKLRQIGLGPEEMKKALEATKDQAEAVKAELKSLIQERENIAGAALLPLGIAVDEKGDPVGQLKTRLADVDKRIFETMENLKLLGSIASIFTPVNNAVEDSTLRFEELAKASQRALDFSKYADQAGGIDAARVALADLNAQLDANRATLAAKGEPGSKDGILSRLRGGVDDEATKKALEAQLDLYSAVEKGEKQLANASAQAGKQRLADVEQNLAKEKALREVSRDEEATALNQQIALAKSIGEAGEADYIQLLERRKAKKAEWAKEDLEITRTNLQAQIDASKAFIDKLEAEGAPRGEIVAAYDRVIARLKEWEAAHGPVLARNKELAQEVGKTKASLTNNRAGNATKQLDDNLKALKGSLKAIGDEAEANALKLGESVTNAQRLEVIDRQIDLAKKAQASSSYKVGEADKILNELGKERLALEQTITAQKLRQQGKENQLAIESIRQEIEMLQIQRDMGLDVGDQLIAKSAELREARTKDLELTYQAERETAEDKVAVEREYQLARKNLEQEFTIDHARESAKRVNQAKQESKQALQASSITRGTNQAISTRSTTSSGSPVVNPYSAGINASGFGSRDEYVAKRGQQRTDQEEERRRRFALANPRAMQIVDEIDRKRAEEMADRENERLKARGIKSPFDIFTPATRATAPEQFQLPPVPEQLRASSPKQLIQDTRQSPATTSPSQTRSPSGQEKPMSQTVNNNQTFDVDINVDGGGFAKIDTDLNSPFGKAVVAIVEDKFRQEGYRDGGQGSWR